jgi:hypothetical protein
MSLCILVRTLRKSASRFSMARADATVSTAGRDSSHDRRIVVVFFEFTKSQNGHATAAGLGKLG